MSALAVASWLPSRDEKDSDAVFNAAGAAFTRARYSDEKADAETEDAIAESSYWSYEYASKVLQGPFPKGEAAIARDAWRSYYYASEILRSPFPAGEPAIASDDQTAYYYAAIVLRGAFPAGEAAIFSNPDFERRYIDLLTQPPEL